MSTENQKEKPKTEEKNTLIISSKKYSTIAEFLDDFDKELEKERQANKKKSEGESKEEEKKQKEEDNKQNLLNHWSKILVKEPPKRRTCHTSFIHDSNFYVIGGIDITEQKQDDIYKVNLKEPNAVWKKIEPLGDSLGRIAYHAGAEIGGYYYIIGGQDENLNTLNNILVFDITQSKLEKLPEVELVVSIEKTENKKLELLKKLLIIIRTKIKDKIDSDRIEIMDTELETEFLKFIEKEELINIEKDIINEINIPTEDHNKLNETSLNIDQIEIAKLNTTFTPDFINNALAKIDEKMKIYAPRLESHTVNAYEGENGSILIIYGGMSGKDYNRHVYCFDPQNKVYKNLTEKLNNKDMPPPRQDHAAVIYNKCLYVYGGIGPDSKIYGDMWKFDLGTNTWEEIKIKEDENKKKENSDENQANKDNAETNDDEDEEEDESKGRPKPRSGHSMVLVGDMFYIFGGKTGLIKESNEIWEFNPSSCVFSCVHETLLEQFTKEELQKISSDNKKVEKKFRWLTRSEIERRTNPSFNDNKTEEEKKKEKEMREKKKKKKDEKKGGTTTNATNRKKNNEKNNKKKNDKNENKNTQNKELEGKYSNQVLCRPNVVKMRKTLIFTSDPEKIKQGLNTLSQDEKEKLNPNIESLKGELPEPRDGQTVCVDGTNIYVFGGDRFKFPFNDLFVLDTNQLPKLEIKESASRKRDKEREKEKENEEKKKKEEEEKKENEEIAEQNEEKAKGLNKKDDIKEEEEDKVQKDDEVKKDDKKKEDDKKNEDNNKDEEECKLLRDILEYPKNNK